MSGLLAAAARLSRWLPRFRGKGRLYSALNGAALRAGARPVVETPMKTGGSMRIDLRSQTEFRVYYEGEYDLELVQAMLALLRPDSVVLDVGANIGFYAVPAGIALRAAGGKGFVAAFEPLKSNYEHLLANVERNGLQQVCRCFNFGLSDRESHASLVLREDFGSGSSTGNASLAISPEFDGDFASTQVQLRPLDGIWASAFAQARVDLVKLDIEGHEDYFLRGAAGVLARDRPVILMEVNKPYYAARGTDVETAFAGCIPDGYAILKLRSGRWIRIPSFAGCDTLDNVLLVPTESVAGVLARIQH